MSHLDCPKPGQVSSWRELLDRAPNVELAKPVPMLRTPNLHSKSLSSKLVREPPKLECLAPRAPSSEPGSSAVGGGAVWVPQTLGELLCFGGLQQSSPTHLDLVVHSPLPPYIAASSMLAASSTGLGFSNTRPNTQAKVKLSVRGRPQAFVGGQVPRKTVTGQTRHAPVRPRTSGLGENDSALLTRVLPGALSSLVIWCMEFRHW